MMNGRPLLFFVFLLCAGTLKGQSYTITTVVGNGSQGPALSNIHVTSAQLRYPESIKFDAADNMYIADAGNACIRRVDAVTGIVTTIAGGLSLPSSFVFDAAGNIYVADRGDHTVKKVDAVTKAITVIAGISGQANSIYYIDGKDGGPATQAKFDSPSDLVFDPDSNLLICDTYDSRIRKLDMQTGIITTVAGGGSAQSFTTASATSVHTGFPYTIFFDKNGDYYITLGSTRKVCKVNPRTGIITTVAGSGSAPGPRGDGGKATDAYLGGAFGSVFDQAGNLYISDSYGNTIRKVDTDGIITTIAGNGTEGYSGDTGPAIDASFRSPSRMAINSKGFLFIADRLNHVIRKLIICSPNTISGPPAVCRDAPPVTLMTSQPGGVWSVSNNTMAAISSDGKITGKANGTVTVTYAVSSAECGNSSSQLQINIRPLPIVDFTIPRICLPDGNGVFVNKTTISDGTEAQLTYKWSFISGTGTVSSTLKDATQHFTTGGPWDIKLLAVSGDGCADSVTREFTTIYQQPKAGFVFAKKDICFNDTVLFSDTSGNTGSSPLTWQWSIDGNAAATTTNLSKKFADSTNHRISLFYNDANGCRSDTAYADISVHAYPVLKLDTAIVLFEGDTVRLKPGYYGTELSFLWSPAVDLDDNRLPNPLTSARSDIAYTLTLTGKGDCVVEGVINVRILRKVITPNAFSPNGDGINDTWSLKGLDAYPGATVKVFDRQGQVIFSSKGYAREWDGTRSGKPLPIGTYYYIITTAGTNPMTKSGSVTILR